MKIFDLLFIVWLAVCFKCSFMLLNETNETKKGVYNEIYYGKHIGFVPSMLLIFVFWPALAILMVKYKDNSFKNKKGIQ